jgi:hypothetical protein
MGRFRQSINKELAQCLRNREMSSGMNINTDFPFVKGMLVNWKEWELKGLLEFSGKFGFVSLIGISRRCLVWDARTRN